MPLPTIGLFALLALSEPSAAQQRAPALHREKGPVFSVVAAPRLGVLLVGGADALGQRVGFGAGLQFKVHALRVGPARFGLGLDLGHTRYLAKRRITLVDDDRTITRYASLGHTDFSAGPSLQLVLGPLFFEGTFGVGVGINQLVRPRSSTTLEEESVDDVTAMIRGGGHIGIPIIKGSSVTIGTAVHKYFSKTQIVADPPSDPDADPREPDTNPFDLMLEVYVGYHFSF